MLSERSYMREAYPRPKTSVLTWLVAAVVGSFILEQVLFSSWFGESTQLADELALTPRGLASGHLWTIATYWLLHSPTNLFHVGLVLLGLFLLGRDLEPVLGARRFVTVFAGSLVVGGLFWAAVNWRHDVVLMGATAGVYGLLALYAALYPNREFSFLVLFFFPVTFKPKHLALGLFGLDLAALVYAEILGNALPFAYAPSAHLGGLMAGWGFYRYLYQRSWGNSRSKPNQAMHPAEARTELEDSDHAPARSEAETRAHLRAEVDRILDKINSVGFGSLTAAEKRVLDEARASLSRR